ncbi:soluble lytic murein transglycosylase [Gammaproteobacteria bacterium]
MLLLLAIIPGRLWAETTNSSNVHALIEREARHWGVDAALVKAVVSVESGFYSDARSPKGAMGLMQLMPGTVHRFGVGDPWDPQQNVTGGVRYLRFLLDRFGGDLSLALAGYNAGENSVTRYGGLPPYPETREYVGRVLGCLREYEAVSADSTQSSTADSYGRAAGSCVPGTATEHSTRAAILPRWGRRDGQYASYHGSVYTDTDLTQGWRHGKGRNLNFGIGVSFLTTSFEGERCQRGRRCRFSERDKQQLVAQRLRWHDAARLRRGLLRGEE